MPFIFAVLLLLIYLYFTFDDLPVIRRSQILDIRSRDPGHAHIGVVLSSISREGPSSASVPNLKRIALFVQKLLVRGSQNFEIGSRDPKPRPF